MHFMQKGVRKTYHVEEVVKLNSNMKTRTRSIMISKNTAERYEYEVYLD